jgi:hypothetical protein
VDRASSQTDVWLDETILLAKLSYRAGMLVAAAPRMSLENQGTDTLAAREDGDLAVRLVGSRRILVLHHGAAEINDYNSSHIVDPDCPGVPMASIWDNEDLVVAMHSGMVYRVAMDGTATELVSVDGVPVALAWSKAGCWS